jgi:hypothetical protein
MSYPINFVKVFVCDYIENIEDAVKEYVKKHRVIPLSVSVINVGGCIAAAVVFEKRWYSRGE